MIEHVTPTIINTRLYPLHLTLTLPLTLTLTFTLSRGSSVRVTRPRRLSSHHRHRRR